MFIKQPRATDDELIAGLEREALCYQIVQNHPELAALAKLTPDFHEYDSVGRILILELLPQASDLRTGLQQTGEPMLQIAGSLGTELGLVHAATSGSVDQIPELARLTREPPWILGLHEAGDARRFSRANLELVRILRRFKEFPRFCGELQQNMRTEALIHGDMKFGNWLLLHPNKAGFELRLVDWERAHIGDPAWDVGGLLMSWLDLWISSMDFSGSRNSQESSEPARIPVETLQPAIEAFWISYREARGFSEQESADELLHSVRCCGARMIQTAFEASAEQDRMTRYAVTLLQVSLNILEDPGLAARALLGLGRETAG